MTSTRILDACDAHARALLRPAAGGHRPGLHGAREGRPARGHDARAREAVRHRPSHARIALNKQLAKLVPEDQIHRVDHFLGRSTVFNLLGLRFANRIFEPLWNAEHIERVDVDLRRDARRSRGGRATTTRPARWST